MSAVVEIFLICDGDKCDGNRYGVDSRNHTAKHQRQAAKLNGWKFIKGKDYCNQCAPKPTPHP